MSECSLYLTFTRSHSSESMEGNSGFSISPRILKHAEWSNHRSNPPTLDVKLLNDGVTDTGFLSFSISGDFKEHEKINNFLQLSFSLFDQRAVTVNTQWDI